jgi:predicted nucleotidyltransferase component of viral defense system
VNQAFKTFLALSNQDRQDVFEAEAEELDTLPTYVEKDFWVCLALDILYNGLPSGHPRLLFKGGTSLSKAYKLIRRFSEDVDFTVFREDLGFGEDEHPASVSGNQRRRRSEELKQAMRLYLQKAQG